MKQEILSNMENPAQLEKLYRADKSAFALAFNELYPGLANSNLAGYWHARLHFNKEDISWGSYRDLLFVILGALLAGVIAKFPAIFNISEEFFYPRNIGFIVFPLLTIYFAWKNRLSPAQLSFIAVAIIGSAVFINMLPDNNNDILILSCIHLALFLWSIMGFAFVGETGNNVPKRLGYLKYNGDLLVMTTLILIAGAILSGITIGLFSLINVNIEKFYMEYVVVFGLAAAPIIGTYLTENNPQLVGKVSPVIARIFSPLVLIMLVSYLVAIIYSGKNPYNDRESLIVFNALLIGVMALIFFSVAGNTSIKNQGIWILFLLSAVTIIVNSIALSAIVFRISEWGITPNRAAVSGGNLLILIHLVLVTAQLLHAAAGKKDISIVGHTISFYLPVYMVWTAIVTFVFPAVF